MVDLLLEKGKEQCLQPDVGDLNCSPEEMGLSDSTDCPGEGAEEAIEILLKYPIG